MKNMEKRIERLEQVARQSEFETKKHRAIMLKHVHRHSADSVLWEAFHHTLTCYKCGYSPSELLSDSAWYYDGTGDICGECCMKKSEAEQERIWNFGYCKETVKEYWDKSSESLLRLREAINSKTNQVWDWFVLLYSIRYPDWKPRNSPPILKIRFDIFKRDNYHCRICGRGAEDGVKLELGHKIAKAKGGQLEKSNLVTLCFDCNHGQCTDEL